MLVYDWMTRDPLTVGPKTPVQTAWMLMQDRGIRHLPVLDGGRLVGIVTDRDIRLVLPSPATSLAAQEITYLLVKMTVAEVMTRDPLVATPSMSLQDAATTLLRRRVGALPVMAGDRLVGILSHSDVLRAFTTVVEVEALARVA
jgi:acetoin utilization protein AcuB